MESIKNNPQVCFFDSGIGGISLLYECVRRLPHVDFTYFADNSRMPYGSLTQNEMIGCVEEKFDEIKKLNPSAAVVACNTVTAQCIDYLRKKYEFNIVGIQPAVKPAAEKGRCLVLATPSTAQSAALYELVKKYGQNRTQVAACPELAAYIEKNIFNLSEEKIFAYLPDFQADAVVLGCTHYVFAEKAIQAFYGCPVFDGIEGTAAHLEEILGICDHQAARAQKITFIGGDYAKNRSVFNYVLVQNGLISQKITNQTQKN